MSRRYVTTVFILYILFAGCKSQDTFSHFDGVWRITHYVYNDSLIIDNDLKLAPENVPYYKTLLSFIDTPSGQIGISYIRDSTTVSKILFNRFDDNYEITISGEKDSLLIGDYSYDYEFSIAPSGIGDLKMRKEILHLQSDNKTIIFYRNKVIERNLKPDYSRPTRPF